MEKRKDVPTRVRTYVHTKDRAYARKDVPARLVYARKLSWPQAQSIVSPIITCVFSNAQIEVEIRTLTDRRGLEYRVWSASTSLALAYHTRYSNPRCDWHKPHIANSREIIVMSTGFNYMNILSSTRIIIVIFFRLNL